MSSYRAWVGIQLVLFALGTAGLQAADQPPAELEQAAKTAAAERDVTQGALRIVGKDASVVECPLKHTSVQAAVSGFIARVDVTQTFVNPTDEPIEAVYVFPLPHEAAVDQMTMVIGTRKIVGRIKRRDEARSIYEQALRQGQTAALLEQQRPNIFTQSVGNIAAGQEVKIEISYVDVLKYDQGEYEFHFPMVVGPRFIPGAPTQSPAPVDGGLEGKVSPPVADTTRVPDASKISPPVLKPGFRNGHDIHLELTLDAGVPVQNIGVANHQAEVVRKGEQRATIRLADADKVPNKDFVVRYDVVGKEPEMALLAHTGEPSRDAAQLGSGYFMLMIQPKEDERLNKSPPREIVFLVDVSGSMRGAKTNKTVEAMRNMLGLCREKDTVQVITFASRATKLFEQALPVNQGSIQRALNFTSGLRGSGGTHMLEGVKLAIDAPIDKERIRIVVMLTDGFIGNEAEIIQHVGKNCGDQVRFWALGIGQSPNMFLVDGVAKQGGGMGKRLGLNDDAETLSTEIMTRIQRAQLANIRIDWGGLQIVETYPKRIPELWAGRPLTLLGRFQKGGTHEVKIRGTIEGESVEWPLTVELPDKQPQHGVLAKVWARKKIEDLMQQTYYQGSPAVEEEVTAIALDYGLMSQYTSFVAVDEQDADKLQAPAQPPRRMLVPVPLPEGAEWEGFFGGAPEEEMAERQNLKQLSLGRIRTTHFLAQTITRRKYLAEAAPMPGAGGFGGAGFGRVSGRGGVVVESLAKSRGLAFESRRVRSRFSRTQTATWGATPFFDRVEKDSADDFGLSLANHAVQTTAQGSQQAAQKAMVAAREAKAKKETATARAAYERAYFLDHVATNAGLSNGQTAAEALSELQALHRSEVETISKQLPGLGKRLNLVLQDLSVSESLRQIAEASGVEIQISRESLEDATELMHGDPLHIGYLDLRNATVAQALDWVLQPVRLRWTLERGVVVAGSSRRISGQAGWVYHVGALATPTPSELQPFLKDRNKALQETAKAVAAFMTAVEKELTPAGGELHWFAPGELLVFGSPDLHQQAAEIFAKLRDPKADFAKESLLGKLDRVTSQRVQERREAIEKKRELRQLVRIAEMHDAFGWQLMAAASAGRLDDEALAYLQIAWQDEATDELLKQATPLLAMRSLWIVSESARAMPESKALAALAKSAQQKAQPHRLALLENVEKGTPDQHVHFAVLFAALARDGDQEFRDRALELLMRKQAAGTLASRVQLSAASLLGKPDSDTAERLMALVDQNVRGDDLVLLTALACRRAGGDAWRHFRAESAHLLGNQPLSGHVVLLVNRIEGDPLPSAR